MPVVPLRRRATALGLALSIVLTATTAYAEDGTSGSTPTPTPTCSVRAAAYAAPSASPVASTPVATPVGLAATPVASPVASPVVKADPLTTDLGWAADGILDCMSENNIDVLTGVTSPEYRGTWLGLGSPLSDEDFAALLPLMPQLPYELLGIENAQGSSESATATVTYTVGRQVRTAEWSFAMTTIDGTPTWTLKSETLLATPAPADATVLKVTVTDGKFTFAPTTVAATEIAIDVSNTGKQDHEVLILRVADGTTAADIAAAPTGIPDGATFIAQATIPAGKSGTVVLTDVRAGTYTVVDLLPDAAGVPNISGGMIGTFTVTKP